MRLATTLLLLALAAPVAAQVTRLEITSREVTGGYERITGLAHGEVDPRPTGGTASSRTSSWRRATRAARSSTSRRSR